MNGMIIDNDDATKIRQLHQPLFERFVCTSKLKFILYNLLKLLSVLANETVYVLNEDIICISKEDLYGMIYSKYYLYMQIQYYAE